VLWHEKAAVRDDAPDDALEEVAAALAAAAGGPAFTVPADDGSLWAWAASSVAPDLAAVAEAAAAAAQEGCRVALGTPGEGIAGFRVGHAEAQLARRVAELSGRPTVVVRYDEVEPVSLMADDPERLARFVRRTLGPLAAENEATARLRRTLRVWLATGGSAPAAAARLGVHKNTVLYRVHRAGALLPRPVDADRLALELALAAADEVGLGRLSAQ
jgi:DNA-binding PucR family transcriptional regulator